MTGQTRTKPPSANPERPDDENPPATPDEVTHFTRADFNAAMAERDDASRRDAAAQTADGSGDAPGLYVVTFPGAAGPMVELHTEETAEARVSLLTYGSKQHRREVEADDDAADLPEGGGSHEINRRDVHVYKLGTTEVTDF